MTVILCKQAPHSLTSIVTTQLSLSAELEDYSVQLVCSIACMCIKCGDKNTGGSTLWGGVSMDTPSPRKKNYYMIFYFYLFFVCILGMILIDRHPCLKSLNPPLDKKLELRGYIGTQKISLKY